MATVSIFGPDVVPNERVRLNQIAQSCLVIVYDKIRNVPTSTTKYSTHRRNENHENYLDDFRYPSPCSETGKTFLFSKLVLERVQLLAFARYPFAYEHVPV